MFTTTGTPPESSLVFAQDGGNTSHIAKSVKVTNAEIATTPSTPPCYTPMILPAALASRSPRRCLDPRSTNPPVALSRLTRRRSSSDGQVDAPGGRISSAEETWVGRPRPKVPNLLTPCRCPLLGSESLRRLTARPPTYPQAGFAIA